MRLRRLEKEMGLTGSCRHCSGYGVFVVILPNQRPEDLRNQGCPRCGRLTLVGVRQREVSGSTTCA